MCTTGDFEDFPMPQRVRPPRLNPDYRLANRTQELLDRVRHIAWFSNVGKPFAGAPGVLGVPDLRRAKKACFSKHWDNTLTHARNSLSGYVDAHDSPRFQQGWNEIVHLVTPSVLPIVEVAAALGAKALALVQMQRQVLTMTLRRQLVGACHESEYADLVEPPFCLGLLKWYDAGRWPCGYEGDWPGGCLMVY